jgi:hypothetical protein
MTTMTIVAAAAMNGIWTVAAAEFSEAPDRAAANGPRTIARNGTTTAVIAPADEWAAAHPAYG